MKLTPFYARYISLLLFMLSCAVKAENIAVEFNGFASTTLSYSDNTDIRFASNYLNKGTSGLTLKRDSILGAQANISVNARWDSVIQAVYQDRSYKGWDNFIELAFLRYRPNRNWAIRAGRLNSDLYLLSEYPYVGYAYLWVRPPHEFYSFASAASRFDGGDIEYNQNVNDGFLRVKLALGKTTTKSKTDGEDFFLYLDNIVTLSTTYTQNEWTFRLSTSTSDTEGYKSDGLDQALSYFNTIPANIWPQASEVVRLLNTDGHQIRFTAAGLTFDNDDWMIQSEIGVSDSEWAIAPTNLNGYLSVGRRFNQVTYHASISVAENRGNIPKIQAPTFAEGTPIEVSAPIIQLANFTQGLLLRPSVHQYSYSVGAKWYFSEQIVFKAQFDHFDIQAYGGGLWGFENYNDLSKKQHINALSLSSSVVF